MFQFYIDVRTVLYRYKMKRTDHMATVTFIYASSSLHSLLAVTKL